MQQAMACVLVLAASCGGLRGARNRSCADHLCERLELPYNGPFEQLEDGNCWVIDKDVLRRARRRQTWNGEREIAWA